MTASITDERHSLGQIFALVPEDRVGQILAGGMHTAQESKDHVMTYSGRL